MPARIFRRPRAQEDAETIADHIAQDSLGAALRFLGNLESTLRDLAVFPRAGSRFESAHPDLENLSFRSVQGFPNHIIFYIVHKDSIEVVRILHGARDVDAELGQP